MAAVPTPDWAAYLVRFHAERAGITEAVLSRARDGGTDPYAWVADAVPTGGLVVDVACGSGPLAGPLGHRWLGLDVSPAELALAHARAAGRLVQADAGDLPLAGGRAAAVVCAMALMLVDPAATLVEARRVLAPGGRMIALLPAGGPLTARGRFRYGRLLLALGHRRLPFPGTGEFAGSGLHVVSDERRRFRLPIDDSAAADRFIRSLYLPGTGPRRLARATAVARRWVGSELGLPLRRIVAEP
jgi:SAM-dependent methyltransferase